MKKTMYVLAVAMVAFGVTEALTDEKNDYSVYMAIINNTKWYTQHDKEILPEQFIIYERTYIDRVVRNINYGTLTTILKSIIKGKEDYDSDEVLNNTLEEMGTTLDEYTSRYDDNEIKDYIKRVFNDVEDEIVEEFVSVNKTSRMIDANKMKGINVITISRSKLDEILQNGWWENFHNIYPQSPGVIWFSKVSYSKNNNIALLYYQNTYAGMRSIGYLVILEKISGKWIVKEKKWLWRA
nr:hypothetical protein [uncultured bacterium]